MFDLIDGLPVHPLVVHAVVVLGPLSALLLAAYALKPSWRVGLRWPTLLLAAVAAASAAVATSSGESLEERVGDPAFDHAEKGELAAISAYVLLGVAMLVVFVLNRPRAGSSSLGVVGVIVALLALGFSSYAVYDAGHSGASSVWKGEISGSSSEGEDGDAD